MSFSFGCNLRLCSLNSLLSRPSRTFVRCIKAQAVGVKKMKPFASQWDAPGYVLIQRVRTEVTREDIIRSLIAVGPIGRVLSLHVGPPSGVSENKLKNRWHQAAIHFDSHREIWRLTNSMRSGKFKINGRKQDAFKWGFDASRKPSWQMDLKAACGPPPTEAPKTQLPSRVVRVLGPSNLPAMQLDALLQLLRKLGYCVDTEKVVIKERKAAEPAAAPRRLIEWHFFEWVRQARHVFLALQGIEHLLVTYGLDPCAAPTSAKRPASLANAPLMKHSTLNEHHRRQLLQQREPDADSRKKLIMMSRLKPVHVDPHELRLAKMRAEAAVKTQLDNWAAPEQQVKPDRQSQDIHQPKALYRLELGRHEPSANAPSQILETATAEKPGVELAMAEEPSLETKMAQERSLAEAEEGDRIAEKRRKDLARPDLDAWVRALHGKASMEQEEERLLFETWRSPRAIKSTLTQPETASRLIAGPTPSQQDPLPSSSNPAP